MNQLTVTLRETKGKQVAKSLRANGSVPAIIYGEGIEPLGLAINLADLKRLAHSEHGIHAIIDLTIAGSKDNRRENVMIKEIQRNAKKDSIVHVDFLKVNMDKPIKTKVAVELIGEPAGALDGGILTQVHHELDIECLPGDMPSSIEVDVSSLTIGHSMTVGDLVLPAGVTMMTNIDEPIAIVTAVAAEAVAEEVSEGEAEPEIVGTEEPAAKE